MHLFIYACFGATPKLCSGLNSGSALRYHSWFLGVYMCLPQLNFVNCGRQMPYLLAVLSLRPLCLFNFVRDILHIIFSRGQVRLYLHSSECIFLLQYIQLALLVSSLLYIDRSHCYEVIYLIVIMIYVSLLVCSAEQSFLVPIGCCNSFQSKCSSSLPRF